MDSEQTPSNPSELEQGTTRCAREALARYGLSEAGLRLLKQGRNREVFLVSCREGDFVLQMKAPLTVSGGDEENKPLTLLHSEEGLHSQLLWMLDLRRATQLPMPEPIHMLDGSLVGNMSLDGVPESRLFALLRWVPGELFNLVENADLSSSDIFSLGSYVARMHRHAEQYSVPEGFVRPRWGWDWLFGADAPQWRLGKTLLSEKDMNTLRSAADQIRRHLVVIGETSETFGLIHRDLHQENLLYHEGAIHAIDFDQCGWGYYLYDLALPYTWLRRFGQHRGAMRESLINGYQSERFLPEDYQDQLETFRAMWLVTRLRPALSQLRNTPRRRDSAQTASKAMKPRKILGELRQFVAGVESQP